MEQQDLKKAMEQIHIKDKMQEDIIRNLRRPNQRKSYRKMGTLVAVLSLAVVIIAIPTQAAIRYLVQERMESIPKEEVETLTEMLEKQEVDADSFSRPYSQKEKERMGQLYRDYQKGIFPQKEILRLESEEQVEENAFCYVEETGCFYFPGRELTDEELLEIIDFNYKRDYALTQSPEVQEEIKQKEEEQRKLQALLQEKGGIDEPRAIEIACQWMETLFGVPIDGMEQNSYLSDDDGEQKYCVNYSVQSQCYYYFFISATDGKLIDVSCSQVADLNREEMEEDLVKEQIDETCRAAKGMLEKLGIQDVYKEIYCLYAVEAGKVRGNNFAYYFIKEDESGYRVDVSCDGNYFRSYQETVFADYEKRSDPEYVKERSEGAQVRTVRCLTSGE